MCSYLLGLSAFTCDHNEQNFILVSEVKVELEKATTINGIFNTLNSRYATFLNYDIFQYMVEDFGIDKDQAKLNYPELLEVYIKEHKVSEFENINPLLKEVKKSSKKLVLKFDIEKTCHVSQLRDLTEAVANILGLRPSALRLLCIEEGCVVVTLLIPAPVADFIFNSDQIFTAEDVKEFQALSVIWMKCNDFLYKFNELLHDTDKLKEDIQANISGTTLDSLYPHS